MTVTYGLRWDVNPPLKGKNLVNQPFTVTGLNNPATIALAPRGTPLYQTTYGNVAARVGVAYQLSDRPAWGSVLRGGFGIFYDLGYGSLGGVSSYFPYHAVKALSPATFPLSAAAGVAYSLPSPVANKLGRAALGGWSVDSFVFARSAPPLDVISGIVFANGIALYPRPNIETGVPLVLYGSGYPGGKMANEAAFSAPPTGQQGNLGRNVLRGFGAWQADIAIQRQFRLTEKVALRFRSEFFNIFNHPNFGPPDNTLTDASFGHSTQTLANSLGSGGANGGFNPLYQIGGPRSVQLALKLMF